MSQQPIIRKRYSKIGLQVRKKLIQRVLFDGYSITSSARFFKVKISTAKQIVSKFRKTGRIYNAEKNQRNSPNEEISQGKQQIEHGLQSQRNQGQQLMAWNPQIQPNYSTIQPYYWFVCNYLLWQQSISQMSY